jgi:hypothetical protein
MHVLDDWSPYELHMAFDCVKDAKSSVGFPLSPIDGIPQTTAYRHKPRRDRAGRAFIHIPQFYNEPPARPTDDAPSEQKEVYAVFALSVFYPYDRWLSKLPVCPTYWETFLAWEAARPRGDRDVFAFQALANVQDRQHAVAFIRTDPHKTRGHVKRSDARADNRPTNEVCTNVTQP